MTDLTKRKDSVEIIEYIDDDVETSNNENNTPKNINKKNTINKNEKNNSEILSSTLIERRKRFHELATEINQWEDESFKNQNININNINCTPPPPPPFSNSADNINKQTPTQNNNNYSSPKFRVRSPSPFKSTGSQINSNMQNKENIKSPYLPSYSSISNTFQKHPTLTKQVSDSSNNKQPSTFQTPSNQEIVNVAHRILSKRNSNSQPSNETTNQHQIVSNGSQSESLVKSIKSKFENNQFQNEKDSQDSASHMTPKLIIKKFEQMLKDGSQQQPLTGTVSISNSSSQLNSLVASKNTANQSSAKKICQQVQQPNMNESSVINTDHIKPKSIIEKFESLVKSQQQISIPVTFSNGTISSQEFNQNESNHKKSSLMSNGSNTYYTGSLTYVSSMTTTTTSTVSPQSNPGDGEQEEAIYDELIEDNNQNNKNTTSMLNNNEENDYSVRSSLTSMAQGEDDDEIEQQDTDFMSNDDYEDEGEDENYIIYDQSQTTTTETDSTQNFIDENDYTLYDQNNTNQMEETINQTENIHKIPCAESTTNIINNNDATYTINNNQQEEANLFSIKEYRKQKRRLLNGGRRSSIMPNNRLTISGITTTSIQPSNNNSGNVKIKTKTSQSKLNGDEDDKQKKLKHMERIKELEELIKAEDNIIHQTGVALEKCLTDANFTGSSEHIECNRLLLTSCQKRQAYLCEINRLKQLISSLNSNSKQKQQQVSQSQNCDNNNGEISAADLTGLLIFSDIQLPIKESYINKLRSGDEKRISYFLILIRHGIQVLQTQVISAQELIATRDQTITFPNRMAINNVDINFKCKVDVYTFEVCPKDKSNLNSNHSSHSSAHSTLNKYFSPLKNNLLNLHHHISGHGSHSNSNSGSSSSGSHSNHHFNEQGVVSAGSGSKTSNFIHVDTIEITIRDIYTNKFKLSISSSSIPLTGLLYMNIRCMPSKSIELKGFMTIFEDINGMGSWDRRWCFLSNFGISYWKYPEDEYRNGPLGTINLNKCITDKCSILPRDICARKFTIELSVMDDNNGNGCETIKRFRLSADTKDQANDWLTNINYALANIRLWNPKAIKPPPIPITNSK